MLRVAVHAALNANLSFRNCGLINDNLVTAMDIHAERSHYDIHANEALDSFISLRSSFLFIFNSAACMEFFGK